jgi:NADPH-dependent 2,4-dienoyl-CoA reductase/sulfur reductase-like enzyme
MRLLVVGGSDAGIAAGLRAREVDPATDVHMIVADAHPNFSICGLPYYLSGEVSDWRTLAHRSRNEIEAAGIRLRLNERAVSIDATRKCVVTQQQGGLTQTHSYDRLIVATGAVPIRPRIEGINLPNVFFLHTMEESFALYRRLEEGAQSAVIVGGGYIGLEMADALRHRGLRVTVIEKLNALMRTVDRSIAERLESLLRAHDVTLRTGTAVTSIVENGGRLCVQCNNGFSAAGDLVLVVVGVRPQSDVAASGGLRTDERGAIVVDRAMRTNVPDVWAAGDCVVTYHSLLERNLYLPLGTTSHKQGRIAGENAAGGERSFGGTLGTQSVKLFDRVVAATGVREEDAHLHGFDAFAAEIATHDHKVYYPGATEMVVRLVGDLRSGALLGGQIIGAYGREISKRIDTVATALYHRMNVGELNELDMSYTPPLSSPWDPIQIAAQSWTAARQRAVSVI